MAQPLRDCPPPGWLRDLWSANGLLEGLPCAAGAPRAGAWPANVSFAQIFDNLVPPRALDRYVINLGANDGARHDPAFPLLAERGYGGPDGRAAHARAPPEAATKIDVPPWPWRG